MAHTYTSTLIHYVFSTKGRRKLISENLRERLWAYLGGIARQHEMKALAVGGTDDHVHMLVSLPATVAVSKAVQLLKGGSSKWVRQIFPTHEGFAWQEGYGAFSISVPSVADTVAYINAQPEHHQTTTFEEEFVRFLKKHDIDYDEQYVWG